MRICFLTPEYGELTPARGGIAAHYAAFAPALARLGHDIHVLAPSGEARGETVEADGVQVHLSPRRLPGRLWFLEDAAWARRATAEVSRIACDLVFAPEWRGMAATVAARRGGPPVVTNLVSSLEHLEEVSRDTSPSARIRAQSAFQRPRERAQARGSAMVVGCSNAIVRWAQRWRLDPARSTVIPNFIDVERTRRLASGALPDAYPEGAGPVVLFSGRLERHKGVDTLVAAMGRVWATEPKAELVLAGADSFECGRSAADDLRQAAGEHGKHVHVLGALPHEELFPALRAADVVAMPSLWENFSIGALEARAVGAPLVATSDTGFADFVSHGENGLLVPPGDPEALAGAISELLSQPDLRRRLGQAAAADAEHYSAEVVTGRYVRLFEDVAAAPTGSRARGRSSTDEVLA